MVELGLGEALLRHPLRRAEVAARALQRMEADVARKVEVLTVLTSFAPVDEVVVHQKGTAGLKPAWLVLVRGKGGIQPESGLARGRHAAIVDHRVETERG